MRKYLTLLLLGIASTAMAQDDAAYWQNWNKNYTLTDIVKILKHERSYADSVEKNPDVAPTYFRKDSYRFNAIFLGEIKKIDDETLNSIKRVLKLTTPNTVAVAELFKQMVLMRVGDNKIWMPIQEEVLKALKQEVLKGGEVLLYCAFMNEHTSKNVLYNHFLISEFIKD